MMRDWRRWLAWLAMAACAGLAPAGAAVASGGEVPAVGKALFARAIQRLADAPGLQCTFVQRIAYAGGGEQRFTGDLAVRRPGRFRWHYDTPYEQLYVSNGKVIWHYEPDLMQAERLSGLDAVDPAVMKLLDGRLGAKDLRLLARERDEAAGVWRFQVRVGGVMLWLGVDDEADLLYVERLDALGNRNRISLSGCARLAPRDDLFSFRPPAGVEVVE